MSKADVAKDIREEHHYVIPMFKRSILTQIEETRDPEVLARYIEGMLEQAYSLGREHQQRYQEQ